MECVVETIDGVRIYINEGQTFILDDGARITYNDVLTWICDGTLKQHGLRGVTPHKSNSNNSTNPATHQLRRLSLLAATI